MLYKQEPNIKYNNELYSYHHKNEKNGKYVNGFQWKFLQ